MKGAPAELWAALVCERGYEGEGEGEGEGYEGGTGCAKSRAVSRKPKAAPSSTYSSVSTKCR